MLLVYVNENGESKIAKFNGVKSFLKEVEGIEEIKQSSQILCISKDFTIQDAADFVSVRDTVKSFLEQVRSYKDHAVSNYRPLDWWRSICNECAGYSVSDELFYDVLFDLSDLYLVLDDETPEEVAREEITLVLNSYTEQAGE